MSQRGLLAELWAFMRVRKKWWLAPILIVLVLVGVSLLAGIILSVFGPEIFPVESVGPDSYSRSAVGHHGFVALLEELDVPVLVSRSGTALKAGKGSVVLVEPERGMRTSTRSRAVGRILARLGSPWCWIGRVVEIPGIPGLLDVIYRFVARRRLAWFGRSELCLMASPELRSRFLELAEPPAGETPRPSP